MATNLSEISSFTTKAQALSGLVLVTPQSVVGYQPENPYDANGQRSNTERPPTLVFNYEGEQTASLESDITDHYVENNIAAADQIALRPEIYTTRGYVGELNDIAPTYLAPLKVVADKLSAIVAYEPEATVTARLAYNYAFYLYQVGRNAVNAGVSSWNSLKNLASGSNGQNTIGSGGLSTQFDFATGDVNGVQNKQQVAFQQFYGYWFARTLFTVQTPWAVFENMAIERLRAIQNEETNQITDFEISFKMIRTASSITTVGGPGTSDGMQGRGKAQASSMVNLGTSSPVQGPALSTMIG